MKVTHKVKMKSGFPASVIMNLVNMYMYMWASVCVCVCTFNRDLNQWKTFRALDHKAVRQLQRRSSSATSRACENCRMCFSLLCSMAQTEDMFHF